MRWRLVVPLLLCLFGFSATAKPLCKIGISGVTAAKDTGQRQRPNSGWQHVRLPDVWNSRWAGYSGGVWYQIPFEQVCPAGAAAQPLALSIDSMSMAGAVYLNNTLLWQDTHLTEPLSRSWNMPRHWMLPASALQKGKNTLWVYVQGVDVYLPGLREVMIDHPAAVEAHYGQVFWEKRSLLTLNLLLTGMLGLVVLLVWVLYPKDHTFIWFAAAAFFWCLYLGTILMKETAPFADNIQHARAHIVFLLGAVFCFCIYTWRFARQQYVVFERFFAALTLLLAVLLCLIPAAYVTRATSVYFVLCVLICIVNVLHFQYLAMTQKKTEIWLLALCLLIYMLTTLHDAAVLTKMIEANEVFMPYVSLLNILFLAAILAWRFSRNLQRIEHFNAELQHTIEQTRDKLSSTLQRQHQLALDNTRLQERLQLAHDLHDGLGGSLVRAMVTVEQNKDLKQAHFLSMLRLMRNDLRQVIDSGASDGAETPETPIIWLAPLRHRFMQIFEELAIHCQWQVPKNWLIAPSAMQCLTLSRVLEEALTNVIKHSQAQHVEVLLSFAQDDQLVLVVQDDGVGFDVQAVQAAGLSVGMRSMQARLERVGGSLTIQSSADGTCLRAEMMLRDSCNKVKRRNNCVKIT